MKYMMMMNAPRGNGEYQINDWSPDDFQAHIAFMHGFNRQLSEAGEMVACEGLTPPAQAKLVRAGKDGRPVTDGPFPETKEFLAGFWIIDVDSPERALEIAGEASTAPGASVIGADGKPIDHLWIEVRQILGSHKDIA